MGARDRMVQFDGILDTVLKGGPSLGPPLPHLLSMVQSDVKRFGIYYKLFE